MRLIDAEELKHRVNNSKYYGTERQRDFCDMIAESETKDAVEVVRCKDCKWYQGVHDVQGHAPCEWFNKQVLWNDFCSNGEPYKGGDDK